MTLSACGNNDKTDGENRATSILEQTDSIRIYSESLGEEMCSCYRQTADWVRKSQHPDFINQSLEERSLFAQQIDSSMMVAKECFQAAKQHYHIQEKKQTWSEEQQEQLSQGLSSEIEQHCPNVAKMLSGERFY